MTTGKTLEATPVSQERAIGVHAGVIELPHANLVLLDSEEKGSWGEAIELARKNSTSERTSLPLSLVILIRLQIVVLGLLGECQTGSPFLALLSDRKHVRAYIHGHTHEWQHAQKAHVHIIGRPAVSYYFRERPCPRMG